MRTAIVAAGLAGLLAACSTYAGTVPGNGSRDLLGVATHQPSVGDAATAADPATARTLDWKLSQLCTTGHAPVQQDLATAEGDKQLVDWQTHCSTYRLSILGLPLDGIVPQPRLLGGLGL